MIHRKIRRLTPEQRKLLAQLTPETHQALLAKHGLGKKVKGPVEPQPEMRPTKVGQTTRQRSQRRQRTHIDRSNQWPPVGTILQGEYFGETCRAEVVAAPRLKAGKALKLLSDPVKGTLCNSYSRAQDVVTLKRRQELGIKGRKGLGCAWDWWKRISR